MPYDPEVGAAICDEIAKGTSLRKICDRPDMPSCSTVFKWLSLNDEFAQQYARAREAQADALYDEILDVSRQEPARVVIASEEGSRSSVDGGDVQHRRLLVDSLKWAAGKMKPKKYGDASLLKLEGGDGGPVRIEVVRRADAPGTLKPQSMTEPDG
jgi:hypothetical protein